jgi:hypothetical protein
MTTKDDCVQMYAKYKTKHGAIPKKKEFFKFSGVCERQLTGLFGRDAYSQLQEVCGDVANKLNLERTPLELIMRQYGNLALQLCKLPNSSDWIFHNCKPAISGLAKHPHCIKWSDFPEKFADWIKSESVEGYDQVIANINKLAIKTNKKLEVKDRDFNQLISHIRLWSPARRRNSEGEYKIELRKHLESLRYVINEEHGESNFDLLVDKLYVIETKKAPNLGEYDRLFGQLARHLQHQLTVLAVIFDPPGEDNFNNFSSLVDLYLNKEKKTVEIIKK